MSIFKHLGIKKGTSTWAVPIYDNKAEAGSAYSYIKVGGTTGYIPLCSTSDSRATAGRVKEYTGTVWAIATSGTPAYKKVTYSTPGSFTFTVPAGVTKLRVEVAGGGGGGGGADGKSAGKGGNGGSGAKTNTTFAVTAGASVAVVVGAGGSSAYKKNNGGTGGTSRAGSVSARGGDGGTYGYYEDVDEGNENGSLTRHRRDGKNGTSYGSGGAGGLGAHTNNNETTSNAGSNGWVIIEYGQGVQ